MKSILITGALGQLGVSCVQYLKNSYNIHITSRDGAKGSLLLDISNAKNVKKVIKKTSPDIVLNLAAFTDVDACEKNIKKATDVNFNGVESICKIFNGHFVQISTDYVFDGLNGPYLENDKPNPLSTYGQTKLSSDEWLINNHNNHTILRTNVVYSYPNSSRASFVKWVVDSLSNSLNIKIVNDQFSNPTWTDSLSPIIKTLIDGSHFGLFNYADKDYLSRFEFARLIAKVFNLDETLLSPIKTIDLKQAAPRPLRGGLNTEKIETLLGITPNSTISCLKEIRKQLSK